MGRPLGRPVDGGSAGIRMVGQSCLICILIPISLTDKSEYLRIRVLVR